MSAGAGKRFGCLPLEGAVFCEVDWRGAGWEYIFGCEQWFFALLNNWEKSVSRFKPVCIQPKQPVGDCSAIVQDCSEHNIAP